MYFLSQQIRIMRIRNNLTQKKLAVLTGLSQSTICRMEIDCKNIQFQHIMSVIRILTAFPDDTKVNKQLFNQYLLLFLGLKNNLLFSNHALNDIEIKLISVCIELIEQINEILLKKSLKVV